MKHELPAILYRTQEHAILLGLEFMFNRTPLTSQKQAETWRDSVLQDYQKLHDSENWEYLPFMKEFRMLVFDGTGENGFSEVLNKAFQDLEGLDYITMNPAKK